MTDALCAVHCVDLSTESKPRRAIAETIRARLASSEAASHAEAGHGDQVHIPGDESPFGGIAAGIASSHYWKQSWTASELCVLSKARRCP